jgi:hypothetical protein
MGPLCFGNVKSSEQLFNKLYHSFLCEGSPPHSFPHERQSTDVRCYATACRLSLILHHLLNVFVQLANKRGFTKKKKNVGSAHT